MPEITETEITESKITEAEMTEMPENQDSVGSLDGIEKTFADYKLMMKHLKKGPYKKFMEEFRRTYGHYFTTMTKMTEAKEEEEKQKTATEIGTFLADAVFETYQKKGKIREAMKIDLGLFMIYYIFPALLLTNHEDAATICDALRDTWNLKFKANINYTDYDTLYKSFQEKIMGLF